MISLHAVFIVTEYHEFLYWCHCVYAPTNTFSDCHECAEREMEWEI